MIYNKEEMEKLRRANEVAESVKVWHEMLQRGDLNKEVFISLVDEKLKEVEEKGGF